MGVVTELRLPACNTSMQHASDTFPLRRKSATGIETWAVLLLFPGSLWGRPSDSSFRDIRAFRAAHVMSSRASLGPWRARSTPPPRASPPTQGSRGQDAAESHGRPLPSCRVKHPPPLAPANPLASPHPDSAAQTLTCPHLHPRTDLSPILSATLLSLNHIHTHTHTHTHTRRHTHTHTHAHTHTHTHKGGKGGWGDGVGLPA